MNIPQLQIQTTRGILGLQIINPVQEIEQPRATLTQQQPAAILEITTTNPKLFVDTTEVRADLDLKSAIKRTEEYAQLGIQGVMEGIARRAQEGQQLAQIDSGSNIIKQISMQNTLPPPAPLGIKFVPDRRKIKMSIEPGTLNMQISPQNPVNEVQVNAPLHRYTSGKVTGEMEQWPSIQIDVKY